MKRRSFGYALFVVIVIMILTSLPFLVGKIDMIYLLLVMSAIGLLWAILRILLRETLPLKREENADT